MERSEGRILVTHVGSFPRPPRLRELLVRQERGEPLDEAELGREVDAAVGAVVGKQLDAGIDIGNDGEQPRVGFSTYVARRLRGFGERVGGRWPATWWTFPITPPSWSL